MGLEREGDAYIIPRYYIVKKANNQRITIALLREDGTPSHLMFAYEAFKNEHGVNVIGVFGSRKNVLYPLPNILVLPLNCKAIPVTEAEGITLFYERLATSKGHDELPSLHKQDTYKTRPIPPKPDPKPLTAMQEEMLAERKHKKKMNQERDKSTKAHAKQKRLKNTPTFPHSMECSDYDEASLTFPCIVQPKMDGCRIKIAKDEGKIYILSRSNRVKYEWYNIQGIAWDIIPEGPLHKKSCADMVFFRGRLVTESRDTGDTLYYTLSR